MPKAFGATVAQIIGLSNWHAVPIMRSRPHRSDAGEQPGGDGMSDAGRIQRAGRFLFEERQAQRRFRPIADTLVPRTVDEAYAV